jgi:hypothetical protein
MNRSGIKAFTWGHPAAVNNPESDAAIARKVAQHYGLEHEFFSTDIPSDSMEEVLRRFVLCSEGRVDHVGGYLDGFALWKNLAESGINGVIRGDNLFGCNYARTADEAAPQAGMLTLDAMRNPLPLCELGVDHLETTVPPRLRQRAGECAQDWYHRLMHGFRQPTIIAALNEIKSTYVEIANPLNIHSCVEVGRSIPSALRDNKKLFNSMADKRIPFARDRATRPDNETISRFNELLADELHSTRTARNLSSRFGTHLANRLVAAKVVPSKPRKLRRIVGRMVPRELRIKLSPIDKRQVSVQRLALRVYVINAMLEQLGADARANDALAYGSEARRLVSGRRA